LLNKFHGLELIDLPPGQAHSNFFVTYREWRPGQQRLVVIQSHQQPAAAGGQRTRQRLHVRQTHMYRQGNQRSSVIERHAIGKVRWLKGKKIATPHLNVAVAPNLEGSLLHNLGLKPVLMKKRRHRPLRQLHTQHAIPLPRQPGQVQTFAAQRHQHTAARG
jgi:hypothetical protein